MTAVDVAGAAGVEVLAPAGADRFDDILTPEAPAFAATLHRAFGTRRRELPARRVQRQERLDAGALPDFLQETAHVREAEWCIAPLPADLRRRRVEITGPVERKMIINALNSGADTYMADFEDSNTPTWTNQFQGQRNLRDAVRRTIAHEAGGKRYALNERTATLLVRPRGWHLEEKHLVVDGARVAGGLVDFALYLFHNAHELRARGTGPYFYLPKLESHLEARLWNDVFALAQRELGLRQGTIRATVLIETILAAFEMEEILYELRDHSAGLNAGRWDYIFSCIKKFRAQDGFCLADRSRITMTVPFMRAYALLLLKTCHRRGAPAIGGMSALIPIKRDAAANARALEGVRADKARDADDGYDGGWVAHPGLVPVAMEEFTRVLGDRPNQISRRRDDVNVTARELLDLRPEQPITEAGLRLNIDVGIRYLASWLAGNGCVPIHDLMEDAATAEISRSQVWQWMRSAKGVLEDGRKVTAEMVRGMIPEVVRGIRDEVGEAGVAAVPYEEAARAFERLATGERLEEFLTLGLYESVS